LSNPLAHAVDNWRGRARDATRRTLHNLRRALPQRCELCAAPSGERLLCDACEAEILRPSPACPVCALATADGSVCGACLASPPAFDATLAACRYAFPADRLVQAFKYRGRLALATWCAQAIVVARERTGNDVPDALMPMPLAASRERERGFNQATEIARVLAERTGIRLLLGSAQRVRSTDPQASLPWRDRARNVRGAFACDDAVRGLHVAVIDDVMTTGATLGELARTLKAAGAVRVQNWVVARTPPAAG
jgi:ComF family protein